MSGKIIRTLPTFDIPFCDSFKLFLHVTYVLVHYYICKAAQENLNDIKRKEQF